MPSSKFAVEIKVGLLILLSLSIFAAFVYTLTQFGHPQGFPIHIGFQNIAHLKVGAPLKHGGIVIGRVQKIRPVKATKPGEPWVMVDATVQEEFWDLLYEQSKFIITSDTVLGEPFVALRTQAHQSPPLPKDYTFRGVDPIGFQDLIQTSYQTLLTLNRVLDDLDRASVSISKLLSDTDALVVDLDQWVQNNGPEISQGIREGRTLIRQWHQLTQSLQPQLQEVLSKSSKDLDAFYAIARDTRTLLKLWNQKFPGLLDNLEDILEKIYPWLDHVLPLLSKRIKDLKAILASVKQILTPIAQGKGTLGGLIYDNAIYDDLRALMHDLKRNPWKFMWKD